MLKLKTKSELREEYLEIFNKCWYNGLDDKIKKYISENLASDFNFVPFDFPLWGIAKDSPLDKRQGLFMNFIRSKMWNEGINILYDIYTNNYYMIVRKKSDKYNNCLICSYNKENINMSDLSIYSLHNALDFSNMSIAEFLKYISSAHNNYLDIIGVKNDNSSKKNRKNKSSNKNTLQNTTSLPATMQSKDYNTGEEISVNFVNHETVKELFSESDDSE